MKKLILMAVLGMVVFESCNKDYTCTCTVLEEGIITYYKNIDNADAKAAKADCETANCIWANK